MVDSGRYGRCAWLRICRRRAELRAEWTGVGRVRPRVTRARAGRGQGGKCGQGKVAVEEERDNEAMAWRESVPNEAVGGEGEEKPWESGDGEKEFVGVRSGIDWETDRDVAGRGR